MTTRVPIRYGGTGANTAPDARIALGVPPLAAYDVANSASSTANAAYSQANAAYAQANAAYNAANNAQVTVYANNSSNVTTQNVNFVNTATVTVTVTADGANANIEFTAAPQTVVNDTYTAAGNTAAAATANIANGLYAIATSAYDEANLKLNLTGGTINGALNISGNLTVTGNTNYINVSTYVVSDPLIYLAANNDTSDLVDIGFMGGHNTSGVYQHSGLIRHAADGDWYLFTGLSDEGHVNNIVDVANTTYATLKANINAQSILINGAPVATETSVGAAANTVRVSQNGSSTLSAKQLNFVNTGDITIAVTDSGDGNANIAFSSLGGGIVNTVIKTVTFTSVNADANLTYSLPISPAGVPYIFVIKNGITLTPNTDYSLAGSTLTVIESGSANDTIEVRYFDSVNIFAAPDVTIVVDSNVVSSQTNTFYLTQNVSSISRLSVSKNGLVLTPNLHFNVTNNIVTLNTAAEINDTMLFVHQYTFGNVFSDVVLKTGDTMTGNLNVAATLVTQNIVPNLNVTYDLGTSTKRFKDLWLSNSTIYLGNTTISANGDKLVVPALELASGANLSNAVLKTGDTMTGQLNIANGGLLIQNGNSLRLLTTTGIERGTIYATQATGALTSGLVIETSGDEEIVFKDASEINMVIQGTGATGGGRSNVGIGTITPTSKLHVVGNANITSGITAAGTIESTSGGIKFPDGTTQTTAAASVTGIPSLNIVSDTTVTAVAGQHYVLTNAAQTTITLAASPSAGDLVYISARNNLANNLIVPNGNKIESNTSNVIMDLPPYSLQLRYINSTLGWILI